MKCFLGTDGDYRSRFREAVWVTLWSDSFFSLYFLDIRVHADFTVVTSFALYPTSCTELLMTPMVFSR